MMHFTREEKERIFVGRTQTFYPQIWTDYVALVSHEKWTREQMLDYNFAERCRILKYAYKNSPFYKRFYDAAGFHPEDVKTEADWAQVPIITKAHVREFGKDLIVERERPNLIENHTGGSTGMPLCVYTDYNLLTPIAWRAIGWATGRAIGEVYPTPRQALGQDIVYFMRLTDSRDRDAKRNAPLRFPKRVFWYDSQTTQAELEACIAQIKTFPDESYIFSAYTGSAYELARYCLTNRITLPRPIVVSTVASILSMAVRKVIEQAFRCPVVDRYGTNEFERIAQTHALNTAEPETHYVMSDVRHVELVDEQNQLVPDGEVGTTIITSFTCRVAPLIRYCQGDRTHRVVTPDPLGMPFDRIGAIQGRETDWMETKDGVKMHPFCGIFDAYPHCVLSFQIRQKVAGKVRLLMIRNSENPNAQREIDFCIRAYRETLKGAVDVELEYVDEIEHDAGKLRAFVREK